MGYHTDIIKNMNSVGIRLYAKMQHSYQIDLAMSLAMGYTQFPEQEPLGISLARLRAMVRFILNNGEPQ